MDKSKLGLKDNQIQTGNSFHVQSAGAKVFWKGFVYIDGFVGQESSIKEFVRRCMELPVQEAVAELRGCFFCILEMPDRQKYAFVDNSGMYTAYICERGSHESYLEAVRWMNYGMSDIDWVSVAEFIQTANVFLNKTHFDGITKFAHDTIVRYQRTSSDPEIQVDYLKKRVCSLYDKPAHKNLLDTFDALKVAISETPVSVDVTGGLDTRTLIAGLQAMNADFELAVSGSENHSDVVLARKVGEALHRSVHVTVQDITMLDKELPSILMSLDGLKAHIITQHRILQLQAARMARGIKLNLRGIGGELFRDFRWTHDFPNYWSRYTNFQRFDRLRIEVVRFPESQINDNFLRYFHKARRRRAEGFACYRRSTNTQSFDFLDWHETFQNLSSRAMSVSSTQDMMTFCPLAEVHRLQHGYHCRRITRFGALFQKHFITRCHPKLAKVKTTHGATASTAPFQIIEGSIVLSVMNTKKLIRKLSQRYLGLSPFMLRAPNHELAMDKLRQSSVYNDAFDRLIQEGVLAPSLDSNDISERFVERILYLGWFFNWVDNQS